MKKTFFLFLVFSAFVSHAQTKKLSIADAVLLQRSTLAPTQLSQLNFIPGTNRYYYIANKTNMPTLFVADIKQNARIINEISLSSFNQSLKQAGAPEIKSFPSLQFTGANEFTFELNKKEWLYLLDQGKITQQIDLSLLPDNAENRDKSALGMIAFTNDNNLQVFDGKSILSVSTDGNADLVYGKSVHREEFGISKGTFWSPKGSLLAFYRMDQQLVTNNPILDISERPAKDAVIKYPMAGDSSHFVTVGIFNPLSKKIVYIQSGLPRDQYLTNIAWTPDEKQVLIAVLNRGQNHLKLNAYDAATGAFLSTILEEKDEKYVQPLNPPLFVPNQGQQFIWQSERDGFNHLYLYQLNGQLIRQITKGNWVVTQVHGFDKEAKHLFYSSTIESPVTRHLCKASLSLNENTILTSGSGTHNVILDENGTYFLDNFQSLDVPREQALYETKKGKKLQILHIATNPLSDYETGKLSLFTIKNKENIDLYARLYYPVNFDSSKKYPCLVYVYGGPNTQLIKNTWNGGGDLWFRYMAQQGYLVFTVDSRGSEARGKAFEQATFRKLGQVEMEDQMTGVSYLKSKSWVDANRLAVFGWSFGGFMTTSLLLNYPDVFKVGIAGGPVIDWKYYEIMYTERYMDTPKENPAGYALTSTLDKVKKLNSRLLMIHGLNDPVVVLQHSLLFLKASVDEGKLVDYFVYPGHEHNVRGKDRAHLYEKITDYLFTHMPK